MYLNYNFLHILSIFRLFIQRTKILSDMIKLYQIRIQEQIIRNMTFLLSMQEKLYKVHFIGWEYYIN